MILMRDEIWMTLKRARYDRSCWCKNDTKARCRRAMVGSTSTLRLLYCLPPFLPRSRLRS